MLTGSAVRLALRELTALGIGLKWPNDVLARSASDREWGKVAGILCNATSGGHSTVVIGIGINVHQRVEQLPVDTATSLALCGVDMRCEDVIVAVLEQLAAAQRTWDSSDCDDSYRAACITIDQQVKVQLSCDEIASGRAIDVDVMGRLVVDTPAGRVLHTVGDVIHVRHSEGE